MYQSNESGVSRIPDEELSAFADTLFSYFYFHLNMQRNFVKTSNYFQRIIGTAVFCIERATSRFFNDVLNEYGYAFTNWSLYEKVYRSYSNNDYFRKLYFISAYILEYTFWQYRILQVTDLSLGPAFWIEMFRNDFESRFESNGGWQGFARAGMAMLEYYRPDPNADDYCRDRFLPGTFMTYALDYLRLLPRYPISPPEFLQLFQDLSLEGDDDAVAEEMAQAEESKEIEDNQTAQVDKELNPLPVASEENVRIEKPSEGTSKKSGESTEQSPGGRNRRKRRHDPDTKDSDTEQDTVQVDKELNLLPVAFEENVRIEKPSEGTSEKSGESTEESPGERNRRKRRHDPEQVDKELNVLSVTPGRKKVQIVESSEGPSEKLRESTEKARRKRRYDSATTEF